MKALLLAAGIGSRLRPLTDTVPKCMVEVNRRPLLDYWFELLFEIWSPSGSVGVAGRTKTEKVFINTNYLPLAVRSYVNASPHLARVELVHEEVLLGTCGTLAGLIPRLRGGDVLVAHADNLTLFDPKSFLQAHLNRPANCLATMMTFRTDTPQSCGIVELDSQGRVIGFHEKVANPPGNLANAAVFLLSEEALDTIEELSKTTSLSDISRDLLPHWLGRLATFENTIYHRDIGTPESLANAQMEFPKIYQGFKSARMSSPKNISK